MAASFDVFAFLMMSWQIFFNFDERKKGFDIDVVTK